MEEMMKEGGMCKCPHHKVIPLMIVLFGLLFVAVGFDYTTRAVADKIWPILIVIGGGTKLFGDRCGCCGEHHMK